MTIECDDYNCTVTEGVESCDNCFYGGGYCPEHMDSHNHNDYECQCFTYWDDDEDEDWNL